MDAISGAVLHGDFGPSFKYKDFSVTELIGQGFPVTLELGSVAMALALVLGVPIGTFAALHHNRAADYATMSLAVVGIAIPSFVVLPFLGLAVRHLSALAAGGRLGARFGSAPGAARRRAGVAAARRISRGSCAASMLEVLRSHFIRTAIAKGLPLRTVICASRFAARARCRWRATWRRRSPRS